MLAEQAQIPELVVHAKPGNIKSGGGKDVKKLINSNSCSW